MACIVLVPLAQAPVKNELYKVYLDGKIAFVDRTGKVVIHTQFDDFVSDFSEGLVEFKDRKALSTYPFSQSGYINTSGMIVIKPQFDVAYSFSHGRALVKIGDIQSFIDRTGKQVIKLGPYQAARSFHKGLAAVYSNFEFWFIDPDGKIVIPKQVGLPKDFSEGLACVYLPVDGKLKAGYVDRTGKIVIAPQFEDGFDFSEGLAAVKVGRNFGFIDIKGKVVIDAKYRSAYKFSDGRARVSSGDKFGYIDATGAVIIPEKYDVRSGDFSEGLAPVCDNYKCGYIDVTGKYVIEPRFRSAYEFRGGVAKIQNLSHIEYIDKKGQYIWKGKN